MKSNRSTVIVATAGLILAPAVAWWATNTLAAWVTMWALAGSLFIALKILTLTAVRGGTASVGKIAAYVMLWPGMDATAFLKGAKGSRPPAGPRELGLCLLKAGGGCAACLWAARHSGSAHPLLVGWVGMIGLIFFLHFGLLHLVSWIWRRLGVDAPPIMHAPIAADSLGDFWGGRWNKAFADAARRFLFRPTVRRIGTRWAGALVFLVSGLVHEVVISLPARGGWGGPTLYFLLQGAGMAVEKSAFGQTRGLGSGVRGWAWMLICTAGPLPLLFHQPFVHQVMVPLFSDLNRLLT